MNSNSSHSVPLGNNSSNVLCNLESIGFKRIQVKASLGLLQDPFTTSEEYMSWWRTMISAVYVTTMSLNDCIELILFNTWLQKLCWVGYVLQIDEPKINFYTWARGAREGLKGQRWDGWMMWSVMSDFWESGTGKSLCWITINKENTWVDPDTVISCTTIE